MRSVVGVGVGIDDEVLSQRAVVALGSIVELSHRKLVAFAGMGNILVVVLSHRLAVMLAVRVGNVVLSHRPVVILGACVGNEVLSHIDLVLFANSGTAVDVLCHRGVVLFCPKVLATVGMSSFDCAVVLAATFDGRVVEFVKRPVKPLLPQDSLLGDDDVFVQAGVMTVTSVVVLKTRTTELVLDIVGS